MKQDENTQGIGPLLVTENIAGSGNFKHPCRAYSPSAFSASVPKLELLALRTKSLMKSLRYQKITTLIRVIFMKIGRG